MTNTTNQFTSSTAVKVSFKVRRPTGAPFMFGCERMLCPAEPHWTTSYSPGPPGGDMKFGTEYGI